MKMNLKTIGSKVKMVGLVMMLVLNCGAAQAQPQQGLMSRLIEIKYGTELYLTTQMKNETNPQKRDSALALYNTMRWKVDGFVYQLSSTLITKNSPKVFKQIDAWCYAQKESTFSMLGNQNIAVHVTSFAEIDAFYESQIVPTLYNKSKTLNLTTNVFYLLKDSYSIIKGLSDLKTRKSMAIVELLDHARLLASVDVMKGVK
jgi:hypothetical protein